MKSIIVKICGLLVTLFLFSGCTASDEPLMKVNEAVGKMSNIDKVINIATKEANRLSSANSRADERVADRDALKIISCGNSRSQEDTLLYVVNFKDDKGFSIVASDDSELSVLAVVPEGTYDPEQGSDNPGFNLFMSAAVEMMSYNGTDSIGRLDPIWGNNPGEYAIENGKYVKYEKVIEARYKCDPVLGERFQWSQGGIYGAYCPNRIAGCSAIAIASMMTWFSYWYDMNSTMTYTFPFAEITSEDVNWFEVFRHKRSHEYYHSSNGGLDEVEEDCWDEDKVAVHRTIGHLCRQIGYEGNSSYVDDTYMTTTNVRRVLQKYLPKYNISEMTQFNTYTTMQKIDRGMLYVVGTGI